ncbi:MAG: hydrogenase maturation protein [Burkholderiales bacterium]|nr:hydrogenase maturation protein [Burkholderiales bacterium]MDE2455375.1 hydrogenase maturation protein [Burkholderiales bacterium]
MRILLLTHSFNSLAQRLFVELRRAGHEVSVEFDIADSVTEEAVALFEPDLVLAPFMKRRIPESVWSRRPCWIVHPGIPGDRGPSALDRAILESENEWGVTVLQAVAEFDAGPVLAHAEFALREATKSDLYRAEVVDAAVRAVFAALARFVPGAAPVEDAAPQRGRARPLLRADERRIDWQQDDRETLLRKIRSADGHPGLGARLFGQACRLYDAHRAASVAPPGQPGAAVARRGPALLVQCRDGALWIGHVRRDSGLADEPPLKLAATLAFAAEAAHLPELAVALDRDNGEGGQWDELHYRESGPAAARIGWLEFAFHNGAMGTRQCRVLRDALRWIRTRPTKVLVLAGGPAFFSNGIHLHEIEAAARRPGDSAADASWRNINAMNDAVLELLTLTDRLTFAALRGNAGAGGCFLALAADAVWAHRGVVLNPHYKNMGNLYGSEYWTYVLPRRVGGSAGEGAARRITQGRLPLGAEDARSLGLVDAVLADEAAAFEAQAEQAALQLAAAPDIDRRIAAKQRRREEDEAAKPLAAYRAEELAHMQRNFYGFDPSYHVARHHFVARKAMAWTPRPLALHRGAAR